MSRGLTVAQRLESLGGEQPQAGGHGHIQVGTFHGQPVLQCRILVGRVELGLGPSRVGLQIFVLAGQRDPGCQLVSEGRPLIVQGALLEIQGHDVLEILFAGRVCQQPIQRILGRTVIGRRQREQFREHLPRLGRVFHLVSEQGPAQHPAQMGGILGVLGQCAAQHLFALRQLGRLIAVLLQIVHRRRIAHGIERHDLGQDGQSRALVHGPQICVRQITAEHVTVGPIGILLEILVDHRLHFGRRGIGGIHDSDHADMPIGPIRQGPSFPQAFHRIGPLVLVGVVIGHCVVQIAEFTRGQWQILGEHFVAHHVTLGPIAHAAPIMKALPAGLDGELAWGQRVETGFGLFGRLGEALGVVQRNEKPDRFGAITPPLGRCFLALPGSHPGFGGMHSVSHLFQRRGQDFLDPRARRIGRIAVQELPAGGTQLFIARHGHQAVDKLEHHVAMLWPRGMFGDEDFGDANQSKHAGVGVIQVGQLHQQIGGFRCGIAQFAQSGFELRGLGADVVQRLVGRAGGQRRSCQNQQREQKQSSHDYAVPLR